VLFNLVLKGPPSVRARFARPIFLCRRELTAPKLYGILGDESSGAHRLANQFSINDGCQRRFAHAAPALQLFR
jgi:hypothetical protein